MQPRILTYGQLMVMALSEAGYPPSVIEDNVATWNPLPPRDVWYKAREVVGIPSGIFMWDEWWEEASKLGNITGMSIRIDPPSTCWMDPS